MHWKVAKETGTVVEQRPKPASSSTVGDRVCTLTGYIHRLHIRPLSRRVDHQCYSHPASALVVLLVLLLIQEVDQPPLGDLTRLALVQRTQVLRLLTDLYTRMMKRGQPHLAGAVASRDGRAAQGARTGPTVSMYSLAVSVSSARSDSPVSGVTVRQQSAIQGTRRFGPTVRTVNGAILISTTTLGTPGTHSPENKG